MHLNNDCVKQLIYMSTLLNRHNQNDTEAVFEIRISLDDGWSAVSVTR